MKTIHVILISALLGLAGCNTVAGMGQDITNTANQTGAYLSGH